MKQFKTSYLVLRVGTGVNLVGHGLVRLLGDHYAGFQDWMAKAFAGSILPESLVRITASIVPPVELILGLLILIGWKTRQALIVASALMMTFIFGSCLIQNWEVLAIQMFYLFLYSVLIGLEEQAHSL